MPTPANSQHTMHTPKLSSTGRPLIFSFFGGSHGYCGEYLTTDNRVCFPRMNGQPSFRDVRETDRMVTEHGELFAIASARLALAKVNA